MPLPVPPPPPPPPPAPSLAAFGGLTTKSILPPAPGGGADRSNLLNEIRKSGGLGGKVQLRKVVTNDRSAPVVATAKTPTSSANGPAKPPNFSNGVAKAGKLTFREQLTAAVKGGGKLNTSHSACSINNNSSGNASSSDGPASLTSSPRHVPSALNSNSSVLPKSETPRPPLPPPPGSKPLSAVQVKGQAPSPPSSTGAKPSSPSLVNHKTSAPSPLVGGYGSGWPTNQKIVASPTTDSSSPPTNEQQRRLRSLTASGAEIGESTNSIQNIRNQLMASTARTSGQASAPRPPPPTKPAHLASSSGDQQPTAVVPMAPPPPPSKPPSQKPPIEEVRSRKPDFNTIRPQRGGSIASPAGQFSAQNRSNSDETIHQSAAAATSPSGGTAGNNGRPAPPPPPQRPPPLPPSINRPALAPPPPPLPKCSPCGDSKRTTTALSNGSVGSSPVQQPQLEMLSAPPPPPPRSDSLTSDFEKRFKFRTLGLLPYPEEFKNTAKVYSNFRNARRSAPRVP